MPEYKQGPCLSSRTTRNRGILSGFWARPRGQTRIARLQLLSALTRRRGGLSGHCPCPERGRNAMLVKFCGMTRQADVDAALRLGADCCGFIFHEGSPRALRPEAAARLANMLPWVLGTLGFDCISAGRTLRWVHGRMGPCTRGEMTWQRARPSPKGGPR